MKRYLMGTVKALDDANDPNGSFEVVLSAPTLDRDGEIIDAKAFDPLPDHITFDIDHGMSVSTTVGSGVPRYDDEGRLVVSGTYSSIPRAQEVRTLVREGHIRTTSVAFMDAKRTKGEDGKTHIATAELLNGAFVPIPSNRESVVISAKEYATKVGSRNSLKDAERLQQIHDLAVTNGATCESKDAEGETPDGKSLSDDATPTTDSDENTATPDSDESGKSAPSAAPVTPAAEAGKSPASGISFGEYVRTRIEATAL